MNKLNKMRCYLCGPIDLCPNQGKEWRNDIKPHLLEMNIEIFDPTDKPIQNIETEENIRNRQILKESEQYEELTKIIKPIRSLDLRMVDKSDFIIAYIDLDIPMCGTWNEIFLADSQKKPILTICKQTKSYAPDWLFGTIPHQYIFSSSEDVIQYLRDLNCGRNVFCDKRWWFFNV